MLRMHSLDAYVECCRRPTACLRYILAAAFLSALHQGARADDLVAVSPSVVQVGDASAAQSSHIASAAVELMTPIPPGIVFERHVVVIGEGEVAFAGEPGELVYDNSQGRVPLGTYNAGELLADDICTTAPNGCPLDRYVTRVTGDRDGSGTDLTAPFSVSMALYKSCPGASSQPAIFQVIPDTEVTVDLPDGGLYEVEVVIAPEMKIPLPSSFYLGLSFSRKNTGVLVGAPAFEGISADRLDFPGFACGGGLGGYPNGPHASFYTQVYVRPGCEAGFPGYRVSYQAGPAFTEGPRDPQRPGFNRFGDDIKLGVDGCHMVAYEVSVKGRSVSGSGAIEFDLKDRLDDVNPDAGGRIPGTRQQVFVFGNEVVVVHFDFDTPIPLPSDVFMTFITSSSVAGPILTGREPTVGSTEETYWRYNYDRGMWEAAKFANEFFGAFDITIYCEGAAPAGACCDTLQLDEAGDAVCRELPEMNCPENRWMEAETCDSDPFVPACGLGRCCTPDDTCEDLTRNECLALVAPGEDFLWAREAFCGDVGVRCPIYACVRRDQGGCEIVHEDPGCQDPFCCTEVCRIDPFCCEVTWDEVCVRWQQEVESCRIVFNDWCTSNYGRGALPLDVGSGTIVSNAHAGQDQGDPPFCCSDQPGEAGVGSLWYTFVATESSARISTCDSNPSDLDSLLQVFRPLDPSTPETACESLETIACNDDSTGCGDGRLSEICVDGLVPHDTYYVLLAGKTEEDRGIYHVNIDAPCDLDEPLPPANDACVNAASVETGTIAFDFAGATFDCPGPSCEGPASGMGKDLWYRWQPPVSGLTIIETCGGGATVAETSLTLYQGCDCPESPGVELTCSAGPAAACPSGARVWLDARDDTCYLIRVGAEAGAEPTGALTIRYACSSGEVIFVDPPDLLVDARQPYPPDDASQRQGVTHIDVLAPAGGRLLQCWSLCEPAGADPPNAFRSLVYHLDDRVRLILRHPIAPGGMTTIAYHEATGTIHRGRFTSHPGNVNGDEIADAVDLELLLSVLRGESAAPWGLYSTDIDHSGSLSPGDVLRLIDLLNGGDAYAPGWRGTARPTGEGQCPN